MVVVVGAAVVESGEVIVLPLELIKEEDPAPTVVPVPLLDRSTPLELIKKEDPAPMVVPVPLLDSVDEAEVARETSSTTNKTRAITACRPRYILQCAPLLINFKMVVK